MIRVLFLIFLIILSLFCFQKVFSLHPMSLLPVGLILASTLLYPKAKQASKRSKTAGIICGILFALFSSFSRYSDFRYSSFAASLFYMFLFASGLASVFSIVLICLFDAFDSFSPHAPKRIHKRCSVFLCSFVSILLIWSIFFLAYYPGLYTNDSFWQLQQALGDSDLSNHHPVLHTLIMRGILCFGKTVFRGSLTASTALLSVIQMTFLAACMAYSVRTIYAITYSTAFCSISSLFYAIAPFNIVFSFTHLKDTWFAGFFLLFCSQILIRLFHRDDLKPDRADLLIFCISCLGVGLFRSNGFYALIVMAPFIFFCFRSEKKLLAVFIICLLVCSLILGPIYNLLNVAPVDPVEFLSVPLQQVSRVMVDGGKISENDYELISRLIEPTLITSTYYSRISDNIKNLIRTSGNQNELLEHKADYFLLWLRLLRDNPVSYVKAYVELTGGFWYPEMTGIPYVNYMEPNPYKLSVNSLLPGIATDLAYRWTHSNNQQSFLAPFFSCGGYVWLMLALFSYSLTKKDSMFISILPSVLIWGTLLLTTPVYCDLRYIFAVVVVIPLFFTILWKKSDT